MFARVLVLVAALFAAAPASALTYDVAYDGNAFDFNARVVTDAQNRVVALTGSMTGPTGLTSSIVELVPVNDSRYRNYWVWNNLFGPAAPFVDWYGILFRTANNNVANLFLDNNRMILSVANPSLNQFTYYNSTFNGSISVTAVPVPPAALLLVSGVAGLGALRKRKVTAATETASN